MSELHIRRDDPNNWIPRNFVSYFYQKCEAKYGNLAFERNYAKDCPIMRFVMDDFLTNSRPLLSVVHFIDWAFEYHEKKKYPSGITVEFLKSHVPKFLQISYTRPKKVYNHLEEVVLTDDQKKWIKEKRKAYKKGESVYTIPNRKLQKRKKQNKKEADPA